MKATLASSVLLVACDSSVNVAGIDNANPTIQTNPSNSQPIAEPVNILGSEIVGVKSSTLFADNQNGTDTVYFAMTPQDDTLNGTIELTSPGEETIVLNDQGINGDRVAGDGEFTMRVPDGEVDPAVVEEIAAQDRRNLPIYHQREQINNIETRTGRVLFDLNTLELRGNPDNIDPARELMITDTRVVDDPTRTFDACTGNGNPNGSWTFATLMNNIANESLTGISGSELARHWIDQIRFPTTVNQQTTGVAPTAALVLNDWVEASGGEDQPLDLSIAPFKLNAIVNRLDLRYPQHNEAGEMSFVFGGSSLSRCSRQPLAGPQNFSVIFEYTMGGRSRDWANRWHNLANFPLGSEAYNSALEALTTRETSAGGEPAQRPNWSSLAQLRTNEEISDSQLWQMRQFSLGDGFLVQDVNPLTPLDDYNHTWVVGDFINWYEDDILANNYTIPRLVPGTNTPAAAASSLVVPAFRFGATFWDSSPQLPVNNPEARHIVSVNTCGGCHAGETNTEFVHIRADRPYGIAASLSGFVTGNQVSDPAVPSITRRFNELERRAQDMDAVLRFPLVIQRFRVGTSTQTH